jgi:hypothetical protein
MELSKVLVKLKSLYFSVLKDSVGLLRYESSSKNFPMNLLKITSHSSEHPDINFVNLEISYTPLVLAWNLRNLHIRPFKFLY